MVVKDRETVVVEGNRQPVVDERRPSYGWLIALVILVVLVILFFVFGGTNLFNGNGGGSGTTTTTVQTPSAGTSTGQ